MTARNSGAGTVGRRGGQQNAGARGDAAGAEQVVHCHHAGDHAAVFIERREAGGGRQGLAVGGCRYLGRLAVW